MTQPTLHCGFEHVPFDGTGRFGGGADGLLAGTEVLGQTWVTHTFAELFSERTLDRMIDPSLGEIAAIGQLVENHARRILDGWVARFGRPGPDGLLRVFVDLEVATLGGREPYVDVVYGERSIRMMRWLCNRIEFEGRRRGWTVLAAPYRPVRQLGLVHARPAWLTRDVPVDFRLRWGAAAVGELLDMDLLWAHAYLPQDPALLRGTTHSDYVFRNVSWTIDQAVAAGGSPEEVWAVAWLEDDVREASMVGIFEGVRRAMDKHAGTLPAQWHVMVAGGWKLLRSALGPGVTRADGAALELVVDGRPLPAGEAGKVLAEVWNAKVVGPFGKVFGHAVAGPGDGQSAMGNGVEPDLEADAQV